jgi:protein SCO1
MSPMRFSSRLLWLGLGLTGTLLLLGVWLGTLKLRAALGKPLPVIGTVGDFALTNQAGVAVSLADLRGHVWIADIIFTRCAGPCLTMSRQMKDLQVALPGTSHARLVSLTTDPDFDTPAVLKKYSERFDADPGRWWFLTGLKKEIAALATDSLKLTAIEKKAEERESPADLFIHSTIFVVVDKQCRLRGVFETTGDDLQPQRVRKELLAAVRRLEHEP